MPAKQLSAFGEQVGIAAWVRPDARDARQRPLAVATRGGKVVWGVYVKGSRVVVRFAKSTFAPKAAAMPARKWTHVALTSDGASVRLYLNGKLAGTTRGKLPLGRGGSLRVGGGLRGAIDDVQIYDRVLDDALVKITFAP